MTITIGIICFVLAYVMFMQFKVVEETNITQIESMRESELTEKLASWKGKYEEVETKLRKTLCKNTEIKELLTKKQPNY